MNRIDNVHNIIKFINDNYTLKISAEELEKMSNYSIRNLQRIFKKITSESIYEYQRRLKLENAYHRIVSSQENITQIAFDIGFDNIQSFSKAFKNKYNVSPSALRKDNIVNL